MQLRTKELLALTAIGLIVALLVFAPVAVWVGSFPLTIVINESPKEMDREILRFATCMSKEDAEWLCSNLGQEEYLFDAADVDMDGNVLLPVKCTGRSGVFGLISTYPQPKYLVVEFPLKSADRETPCRKIFSIPKGRGPRKIEIKLP